MGSLNRRHDPWRLDPREPTDLGDRVVRAGFVPSCSRFPMICCQTGDVKKISPTPPALDTREAES
jgi:hypothetical protein